MYPTTYEMLYLIALPIWVGTRLRAQALKKPPTKHAGGSYHTCKEGVQQGLKNGL